MRSGCRVPPSLCGVRDAASAFDAVIDSAHMNDSRIPAPAGSMEFLFRWFGPHDPVLMRYMAQVPNVRTVVSALDDFPPGAAWTEEAILERKQLCAAAGLDWTVVESVPVHESIKMGLPERDAHLEAYGLTLRRLGQAGIHTVCYNFMPVF